MFKDVDGGIDLLEKFVSTKISVAILASLKNHSASLNRSQLEKYRERQAD